MQRDDGLAPAGRVVAILLHLPLLVVAVSIVLQRERQQNDCLACYTSLSPQSPLSQWMTVLRRRVGFNMFCQYIQLWMYVVPAADLWRQCRPLFSALDIKAQLTVCSLSPLFPPASHSSPLIFLSPCSLSAPRPLLPPFSLLPSSSAHSDYCRAAKTGPTSVAMLPATVLAVLLPSTPLVAPGILRSHPCLCRRWMVSPSGRVWSPPPPGRPPAGAPPEQQEGEGGAGGARGAGGAGGAA